MGTFSASLRRGLVAGVVTAGVAMVLLAPSTAYAANRASWSVRRPISKSTVDARRPKISVRVYDSHGMHDSRSYSVTLDGQPLAATATYMVKGGWNPKRPDRRRVRFAGVPTSDLAPGRHVVTVRMRDKKHKWFTHSWAFTVDPPLSFSAMTPANGSSISSNKPAISVRVHAEHGIAGVQLWLDEWQNLEATLSGAGHEYTVTSPGPEEELEPGWHTVTMSLADGRDGEEWGYGWSFYVLPPPPPPPTEMPGAASACADCHDGYPAAHPMTACVPCHNPLAPDSPNGGAMRSYTSNSPSGHVRPCAHQCHGTAHLLDDDCARCHSGGYIGIPGTHSTNYPALHASTSTFCTQSGCHASSLTLEHYAPDGTPRLVGGQPMDCWTCHGSANADVINAIADGSTACESCHEPVVVHEGGTTYHESPAMDCTAAGCHPGPVASVHKGNCLACHAPGKPNTTTCTACHLVGEYHLDIEDEHDVTGVTGCVATECHADDASAVHAPTARNCAACHITAGVAPASGCAAVTACHLSGKSPAHLGTASGHTPPSTNGCVTAVCHREVSLVTIHATGDSCLECHWAGKTLTPTTKDTCTGSQCHPTGVLAHTDLEPLTHVSESSCATGNADACHSPNVLTVHAGVGCTVCHHDGSASTDCVTCHPLDEIIPSATVPSHEDVPEHTTGSACATPECHGGNITGIHSGKCSACHAEGKTAVTECATCHQKAHAVEPSDHTATGSCVELGCHAANVTETHGGKCLPCHFQSYSPSNTCLGSNCHGDDIESTHKSHESTLTTGEIWINEHNYGPKRCDSCHQPLELLVIHGGEGSCGLCHPQPAKTATKGLFTCAQGGCHTVDDGNMKVMHGAIDETHTLAAVPTDCVSEVCHDGGDDVAAIHDAVGCVACHNGGPLTVVCRTCHEDYPDLSDIHESHLASLTTTDVVSNGSTYAARACADCHPSADLQFIHGADGCFKCHEGASPANGAAEGDFTCSTGLCHTSDVDNMKVMHGAVDASHDTSPGVQAACGGAGCHGATIGDVALIHSTLPDKGCSTCHDAGGTHLAVCRDCHGDYPNATTTHGSHISTFTPDISINRKTYTRLCTECHGPTMDLQDVHGADSCATCHAGADPAGDAAPGDFACAAASCHVTGDFAMHADIEPAHETTDGIEANCGTGTGDGCHKMADLADLATIHASAATTHTVPRESCSVCHGNTDRALSSVCADCHEPHGSIKSIHSATPASETISINGDLYGKHECSECHTRLELDRLHDNCSTCHPRGTTVTWDRGCVQGLCHTAGSTLPMHGAIDDTHTLDAVPTSCVRAECHAGGDDVAAIHAANAIGCAACHNGDPLTTACVTCHEDYSDPSDIHGRHDATLTAGTIRIQGHDYTDQLCADCHASMELQFIHGGPTSCTKCHPDPADTVISGTFDCAQAGCHVTADGNMEAMHGSVDASHTAATAPSCTAAGCHEGGSDIAEIHAATDTGCAACHNGQPLTAACGTCHVGYPSGPGAHTSHVSTFTPDITINATAYTRPCTECHTSMDLQVVHGPVRNESCVKCHAGADPAGDAAPGDFACAAGSCHTSGELDMHVDIEPAHETSLVAGDDACTNCHNHARDLATIHASAATTHTVPRESCSVCHGNTDAAVKVAMDAVPIPACAACHVGDLLTIHPNVDHTSTVDASSTVVVIGTTSYGPVACSLCHKSNVAVVHGTQEDCGKCHPDPAGTLLGSWNNSCVTAECHTTPSGDMEPMHATPTGSHATTTGVFGYCGAVACHDTGATNIDVAAIHARHSATHPDKLPNGGCGVCHTADGPAPTTLCSTSDCHEAYPNGHAHTIVASSPDITINGDIYTGHSCAECHQSDLSDVHGGAPLSCAKCHPSPRQPSEPYDGGCVQTGCHVTEALPMEVKHGTLDASHATTTGVFGYCGAVACHDTGATGIDVAAIHARHSATHPDKLPNGGCGVCHTADGPAPTKVCSTSDCHETYPAKSAAHTAHASTNTTNTYTGSFTYDYTSYRWKGVAPYWEQVPAAAAGSYSSTVKCGTCHGSTDLQVLPGHGSAPDCGTCHPTPASLAGNGNFACSQTMCHGTGSIYAQVQHSSMDASHTVAQTGCSAVNCHPTNVAGVHGRTGCVACHANPTHPDGPSLNCAHCHGAVDHSTAHDAGCNYCHDNAGAWSYGDHWPQSVPPDYNSCTDCHGMPGTTSSHRSGADHNCHGSWDGDGCY